ncbi:MAG TPA: LytTR family DNA-binding domain-containing protein [Perlabentimonas sp.]|jgi:two-component system LytT family response regulator|nr:LytTR family DNA-binding domain-containing protein [Bacteroidales bacterium]MDD4673125.1 LytTR family DNA-binding domain-containing protein [Bacteroidales bacterium]MDY0348469.1 LytTR family DNA-binding domain-containing protein [Tenuifilaceae bacterium]HZJ73610.1 LytTR family DNA-binding domain-containing protein [Perlabentimonas sp.]
MRTVIVEDEAPASALLKKYLSAHDDIELIGEYGDGFSAAVAINRDKPDLILLDIQLPRINGFEMLEVLDHMPLIVFTTAYDEYAVKAFERNAIDYLLKPFSSDRFNEALAKARERLALSGNEVKYSTTMANDLSSSIPLARIVVKDNKGIHIIGTPEIRYFEAQDDYIMVHCEQGRFVKKQTMKSLEERLNPKQFVRIHRSYIVNVANIKRIEPYEKESYLVFLKNDEKIKASASGYKLLRSRLDF